MEIRQLGLDRIFYISFSEKNGLVDYFLVFEIMGPRANVYLLNSERRIALQHKKTKGKRMGKEYCFDEFESLSAEKTLRHIVNDESPIKVLEKRFKKLPEWIKQMEETGDKGKIKKSLLKIVNEPEPYISLKNNVPLFISPVAVKAGNKKASFSAAVLELYEYEIREERKKRIKKVISKRISSMEKTVRKLKEQLEIAISSKEFRKKGELILVYLGGIRKGENLLKVKDPYDSNKTIEIKMDASKSAAKNADDYFKKCRKAERSLKVIEKRKTIIKKEIERLERLIMTIQDLSLEELSRLEKEFVVGKSKKEKQIQEKKEFRILLTKNGKTVLVGRNKAENERLTFKVAKGKDIFFHVREAPGSHTILVNDGKLTKEDIIEAARIAANFSKAKHSKIVPVSYTEKRYVRKSKKLALGEVLMSREKTLFVEPFVP